MRRGPRPDCSTAPRRPPSSAARPNPNSRLLRLHHH
ncbi:unnamed protein product [Protopolystoma xenopodis]|uniref:Uncharacterized protein n=1 Tax=Protopolystoma xenopodis TaxID=117903 RepID=A0A3S5B1Q9_9PLAT|nr:unnamed protein product [Protopolystoma xenopodis]